MSTPQAALWAAGWMLGCSRSFVKAAFPAAVDATSAHSCIGAFLVAVLHCLFGRMRHFEAVLAMPDAGRVPDLCWLVCWRATLCDGARWFELGRSGWEHGLVAVHGPC